MGGCPAPPFPFPPEGGSGGIAGYNVFWGLNKRFILGFKRINSLYVVFKLIVNGWSLLFKVETQAALNEWVSAIIAAVRGIIFCGLLFVFLLLSGNDYVKRISQQSFTGFYLVDFSPRIYRLMYEGLVSRFFPDEPLNDQAFEFEKSKDQKNNVLIVENSDGETNKIFSQGGMFGIKEGGIFSIHIFIPNISIKGGI